MRNAYKCKVGNLNGRHFEIATHKYTANMRVDYEEVGLMTVEWFMMGPNWGRGEGGRFGCVLSALMNF